MNKSLVVILAIAVVVISVLVWDHESRVEYTVEPGVSSELLDTVTFTVSTDLDEAATVTLCVTGRSCPPPSCTSPNGPRLRDTGSRRS